MDTAGLLLTGGASRRMGRDKGSLPHVPALAAALAALTRPAYEVGPGFTALPRVEEARPFEGPLAALAAAVPVLAGRDALVLACDLPFMTEGVLAWLAGQAGTAVPVVGGRPQPLAARWAGPDLERAPALVAAGERSLRALLDGCTAVTWVAPADPAPFADADTPAELGQ